MQISIFIKEIVGKEHGRFSVFVFFFYLQRKKKTKGFRQKVCNLIQEWLGKHESQVEKME